MGTVIFVAIMFAIGYGIGRTHGRRAESNDISAAANKVFGHLKNKGK